MMIVDAFVTTCEDETELPLGSRRATRFERFSKNAILVFDHASELAKQAVKRLFSRLGWLPQVHQLHNQFTLTLYFSQRLINIGRRERPRHIRNGHFGNKAPIRALPAAKTSNAFQRIAWSINTPRS